MHMSECKLATLPSALSDLSALTRLDLSGNPGLASGASSDGWRALAQLPCLRELCLAEVFTRNSEVPAEMLALHLQGFLKLKLTRSY